MPPFYRHQPLQPTRTWDNRFTYDVNRFISVRKDDITLHVGTQSINYI